MRYLRWASVALGLLFVAGALATMDGAMKVGPTVVESDAMVHSEFTTVEFSLVSPLALLVGLVLVSLGFVTGRRGKRTE